MARKITVRAADPGADRAAWLDVIARNMEGAFGGARRFDWLHRDNPAGPSHLWVAECEGRIVGTSAAIPKPFVVDGRESVALNLTDFALEREFRWGGPALQLLRATLEPVREGLHALSYDHGNEGMMALYRRIPGAFVCETRRWALPFRVSRALGRAPRALGRAADGLLGLCWRLRHRARGVRVEPLDGGYGEEFRGLPPGPGIAGVRSPEFLEWRYRRNILAPHYGLKAYRAGTLVGHLGYRIPDPALHTKWGDTPNVYSIVELRASDPAVAGALLGALIRDACRSGANGIWTTAAGGSPMGDFWRSLGFRPRDLAPAMAVVAAPGLESTVKPERLWIFEGDREG
jgi:hypothetical protein